MKIIDALSRARDTSKEAAHNGVEWARDAAADVERAIRRSMRVHPRKPVRFSSHPDPDEEGHLPAEPTGTTNDHDHDPEVVNEKRKPIVSINGTDVETEHRNKVA